MEKYSYEPFGLDRPMIRLLRLYRGSSGGEIFCSLFQTELLERDSTITYEALSYTWGSQDKVESIIVDGYYLNVTSHLFIALQHLRHQHEDRILWIDAICIDQRNDEERGHQVEQMSEIYKNADQVVFWLGPGTPETDVLMESLQLLQRESIKHNYKDWSLQHHLWSYMWSFVERSLRTSYVNLSGLQRGGLQEILRRPWFRRVWILQEVALARVGIVLCGTKKALAWLFGLVPLLLEMAPNEHCQSVLDIMPSPWRKTSWWSKSPTLRTLLLNFGDSEATEPRDLVYALRGMSSDAARKNIIIPDYAKSEEDLVREVVRFVEHCDLEDFGATTPPCSVRDLIKCLKVLETNRWVNLTKKSSPQAMKELLLRRPEVKINQQVVVAAAEWDTSGEITETLLRHRPKEYIVSDEVLIAAAKNPTGAYWIFKAFSRHLKGRLKISEAVIEAAAANSVSGDRVLRALLTPNESRNMIMKEEVLIAIATNNTYSDKAIRTIRSYKPDLGYSLAEGLKAARENKNYGIEMTIECGLPQFYEDPYSLYSNPGTDRQSDQYHPQTCLEHAKVFTTTSEGHGDNMLYLSISYEKFPFRSGQRFYGFLFDKKN